MRPRMVLLSLPFLALTAAACGSASTASPTGSGGGASTATASPTASADAICLAANTKINALSGAPTTNPADVTDAGALPPIASFLDKVIPFAQQEQTELAAAPDGSAVTTTFADVVTKLQATDDAAKGTDVAAFTTSYIAFSTANTAFHAAAQAANLPNCAK